MNKDMNELKLLTAELDKQIDILIAAVREEIKWLEEAPKPCPLEQTAMALQEQVELNKYLEKRLKQREWVELTDREIIDILWSKPMDQPLYARAIEAKLKEKNNGTTD
jgi:hypothetical protein